MLLRLTTAVLVFLVWTPVASAWSWPVQGSVAKPFAYDESHPYAAGQHRGIDIQAAAMGDTVVAPAAGTVTFAGTVPTSGKCVTIATPDGYSVRLTHLGSALVSKGATVEEGTAVGIVGPSGTPEMDGPYVHLGIRIAADENGYVDPLGLLPPVVDTAPTQTDASATQPTASGGSSSSSAPVAQPVAPPTATTPAASAPGSTIQETPVRVPRHIRSRTSRRDSQIRQPTRQTPVSRPVATERRVKHHPGLPHHRMSQPVSASRRPVVEAAAPEELAGLDTGHESAPSVPVKTQSQPADWLALACNGAAALVAVAAALRASRRRRKAISLVRSQVIQLPMATPQKRRAA